MIVCELYVQIMSSQVQTVYAHTWSMARINSTNRLKAGIKVSHVFARGESIAVNGQLKLPLRDIDNTNLVYRVGVENHKQP